MVDVQVHGRGDHVRQEIETTDAQDEDETEDVQPVKMCLHVLWVGFGVQTVSWAVE